MVFFIGELSVRIGPCDMVFSIIGDFGMVFSIVGLSVTDSPSWTPPLWMIFILRHGFLHRSSAYADSRRQCMSVFVCCSLAHVEQGRSTCNVSRSLSVELFCFAACVCHVCVFRFLARSLTSSKDDPSAMSVALSLSSFFALQMRPDNLVAVSSSFLLRNALLACQNNLTVERYAVRWPTRSRNSYEDRRENQHET